MTDTAAPAPEKRKSTKERVNKAITDLIVADGFDLSATDEARAGNLTSASFHRRDAQRLRERAEGELCRWAHTTADAEPRGNGGELVPLPEPAHPARRAYVSQRVKDDASVLRHQASAEATFLLCDADALTLGLELADDLKCKTRAEKMLAHQAAAFHVASLQFLARSKAERDRASSSALRGGINQAASVESARMMNAAARATGAFADAVAAIKKLKTGGKQTIQVQHVVVKDGGQAVVGQNVKGGAGKVRNRVTATKTKALPRPKSGRG